MAVERIGYTTVINTGGIQDIPFGPTGGSIQEGDWMVLVVAYNATQTLALSGWTNITNNANAGTLFTSIFAKKRVSTDGNYSLHVNAGTLATLSLMWLRGVADSGWVIGTGQNRNGTGSTFNNIARSITTTEAMEVLTISTERTSATEVSYTSATGTTPWFYAGQSGSYLETIFVGYKDMLSPGVTGDATIVYPNTQASNGWGIQIGLPFSLAPTAPLGVLRRWDGTQERPVTASLWNGAAEVPVVSVERYNGTWTRADLFSTTPFYIAHRGSGGNWPEHTMRSYTGAADWGMKAIEVSAHMTSDGVLVCHHDASTLRMTGTDLTVATSTKAQLDALTSKTTDTDNPGQPRQPIPLLSDVLSKYGRSHVLFIEPKAGTPMITPLRTMIQTYCDASRVVWKSSAGGTNFQAAKDLGWGTWGYLISSDQNHLDNYQNWIATRTDIDMWGVERGASDAFISDVVARATAVGKKVIMWEIPTIADRNRATALGCVGMMTSNIRAVLPKFT